MTSELESLRHLRELKADYNKILDLDGLQNMDGLIKLSLQGNLIQSVDLSKFKWSVTCFFQSNWSRKRAYPGFFRYRKRLEMINISQNRLERITGVDMLQSLVALNLGEDMISTPRVGTKISAGRQRQRSNP